MKKEELLEKEFVLSLKSVETENTLDLYFYRPVGYLLARAFRNTRVTPNMVTVVSIFIGAGSGHLFYFNKWSYSLTGILLLVLANLLDCVDGQLARLTGRKSEIGRILDGVAGDIWFILIYTAFALQLTHTFGTAWFFLPAIFSGLSHLVQANITDYYKTLHLYFVSKEKGCEFRSREQVRAQQQRTKKGLYRFFYFLYEAYTCLQEHLTPALQQLMKTLHERYGDDLPEMLRQDFRRQSRRLMKRYIDLLTFNGRTLVLFAVVLSGHVWVYFIYEGLVLNLVLWKSIRKHERMCRRISEKVANHAFG
ncbi:MAG: CDP-alcohol phosphatidyltransferase family protein [Tannerella sp.]|jgi:phosphatidylglycerophosphate synthase|nr:CDP-alcohol phosphatidyltransferase family protein [Tannerella sp.]